MISIRNSIAMPQYLGILLLCGLCAVGIVVRLQQNESLLGGAADVARTSVLVEQTAIEVSLAQIREAPESGMRAVRARLTRNPALVTSPALFRSSSYTNDWFAAAFGVLVSDQRLNSSTHTIDLSQLVYYTASNTLVAVGMTHEGGSSQFVQREYQPGINTFGQEQSYSATVGPNGAVVRGTLVGSASIDPELLTCAQNGGCNSSSLQHTVLTSRSGALLPSLRFVFVQEAFSASIRVVSAATVSLDYLDAVLSQASIVGVPKISHAVFALCDENGFVLATNAPGEIARRSRCLAYPTYAEQVACLRVHAAAYPDRSVTRAYSAFSHPETFDEAVYRKDRKLLSAGVSVSVAGRRCMLLFDVELDHLSLWLVIIVLVVAFAFEVFAMIFFHRLFQRSVFAPMQQLQSMMEHVAMLDFSEVEGMEKSLEASSVSELRELNAYCFEMSGAIASFGLYVPKEVIRELQQTDGLHSRVMTTKLLTFIFIDIANFTTMCEALQVDQLAAIAEKYFSVATRTCTIHGATIDKFIGDAIFGFWGAPLDYTAQGFSACCTALHIQTVVDRLQPTFAERGLSLIVRMGIHRGHSLVGNIGCDSRITYTAIGVNASIAVKLEGLNKPFGTLMILSEAVKTDAERVRPDLFVTRLIGAVAKHDSVPIRIYELCGLRRESTTAQTRSEVSQRERIRRKHAASVRSGSPSESGLESCNASNQDMSTVQISSHATGSSGGEKFALLTEEEELGVIKPSYHLDPEVVSAIKMLSEAAECFLAMRFEQAVSIVQTAISEHHLALSCVGLRVPALEVILKHYEKHVRQRPTERQFCGGVIKL